MLTGTLLNIQRFCTHDGPGIRTTVFLKGCPLACWWCHNPESQSPRPQLLVSENLCLHCDTCVTTCPNGTATRDPLTRFERCTHCARCVDACPADARHLLGTPITVPDLLKQLLRDRPFYDESHGGITLSGGEPLSQPDFLLDLLQACHRQGLHTAVDTCGYASWRTFEAIAPFTDLFLYDLKLVDDTRHTLYTGVSNQRILQNLQQLARLHKRLWIRIPLIPGINDSLADLTNAAAFLAELPAIERIDLLPYHATGSAKFARLGEPYRLSHVQPPTPESLDNAANALRRRGLPVHAKA